MEGGGDETNGEEGEGGYAENQVTCRCGDEFCVPYKYAHGSLGKGEHENERPVGMLWSEVFVVGGVGGEGDFAAGVFGGWLGDRSEGSAAEPAEVALAEFGFFLDVDFDNLDGLGGAGLHAGGGLSLGESVVAHVALANDASFFGVFRDIEGALKDAVRATDALVVEMADDAGVFGLFVGLHGAAVEAFGVGAVVAGGSDGLLPAGFFFAA